MIALVISDRATRQWSNKTVHFSVVITLLLERRLDSDHWVGHAQDHVLVAVSSPRPADDLENVVATVRLERVDVPDADRLAGRILHLDRPVRRLSRAALPMLDEHAMVVATDPPAAPAPAS